MGVAFLLGDIMKYTKLNYDGFEKYLIKESNYYGGFQWIFEFPNGYGASVIKHHGSYGNEKDLFELAVLKDGHLCYTTPITDDVIGFLTNKSVLWTLEKIKNL